MDLSIILTAGGAVAAAAIVTGLIAMLKLVAGIGPIIVERSLEPTVAFVLSAVLVILAFAAAPLHDLATAFGAFLAWFGIAQIAMGVHDTIRSVAG